MAFVDETRFVERLQFFRGQRLMADDLQGLEGFHREMRELHNRSLHQAGVGNGFAVYGERGDRRVTVGPGYAIDSGGREIILTAEHAEPVPPVEGDDSGNSAFYDLTVSYPPDGDLEETETRAGVCLPRGVVRRREKPVFCWVRLERDEEGRMHPRDGGLERQIKDGHKILLARAEVQHCELLKLSIAERRNARPPTQPYIACGVDESGGWAVREGEGFSAPIVLARKEHVDTSTGDFLTTPAYFARLMPRKAAALESSPLIVPTLLSVDHPKADRFSVQVVMMIADPVAVGELEHVLKGLWVVQWMGVE